MPRPKAANAAATRARILSAAGDAFASRGQAGASVRQIASAADVSLAMINHYFGSKGGLYDACIEAMYAELAPLRETLLAEIAQGAPLSQLIPRAVREGFRFARSHQLPSRLLFRQLTVAGQLEDKHVEREQLPFLEMATTALAAVTKRTPASLRLPLQSAVVLVARYGISSPAELASFVGDSTLAPEDVEDAIEQHLIRAAMTLLDIHSETS